MLRTIVKVVNINMKATLIIIALMSFVNVYSQNLNCLDYELYNSDYDAVQTQYSSNSISDISKSELKPDSLQLIVISNSYLEFPNRAMYRRNGINNGFEVILINNSSNDYSLFNMDGKIVMKRQVYFEKEWRNVESYDKTPQYICGNSFFTKKVIDSGDHFTFVAPCLKGNIKARFRFVIFTKPINEQSFVFSNEFEGFINKKLIE